MTVPGPWRKSRRSNPSGNCVQCRDNNGLKQVRDSKLGDASPVLNGLEALVFTIKRGL